MKVIHFLSLICVALCICTSAQAQNVVDHVTISAPPSWVKPVAPSKEPFALGAGKNIEYLLVDRQSRYGKKVTERYSHYVERLNTSQSVEDFSTFEASFDPDYQSVKLHHINVIRNGISKSRLDLDEMILYREETEREKLLFNGILELALVIPDIRIGDTLDYAYTISGKNPAYGPHATSYVRHQYNVPVQKHTKRIQFEKSVALNVKSHRNAPAPRKTVEGQWQVFNWSEENVEALNPDHQLPDSYIAHPATEISTFKDWAQVGQYFTPFYTPDAKSMAAVAPIAQDILEAFDTPKDRARAALDFVQREVRYLGIELGAGGYIPRQPSKTLYRRFGDCKDMTLLLIALLSALDIEAVPLLVDFDLRGDIDVYVPRHNVFDHVIVKAEIDGTPYYLDATKGEQLGDLDTLQQGYFEKGLPIAAQSPGLITASISTPDYWKDYEDIFDLRDREAGIKFVNVSQLYGAQADHFLARTQRDTREQIEESYLEFYQDHFPTIQQTEDMKIEFSDSMSHVKITSTYLIKDGWEPVSDNPKRETLEFPFADFNDDFPAFDGTPRSQPYKLSHPIRTRQSHKYLLDDSWNIEPGNSEFDLEAFHYQETESFSDQVFTRTKTYKTKANHISADSYAETMKAIDAVNDAMNLTLTNDIKGANAKVNDIDMGEFMTKYYGLLFVLGLGVFFVIRRVSAGKSSEA